MKMFSKLWLLFAIIETAAALLNPYVGFFGFFNATELFFMVILYINIIFRLNTLKKNGSNAMVKFLLKPMYILSYIIPVVLFFVKLIVGFGIFIVTYSSKEIMAPYQIWRNPDIMGVTLLVVEMVFNLLLLIAFICKGRTLKGMIKEYA